MDVTGKGLIIRSSVNKQTIVIWKINHSLFLCQKEEERNKKKTLENIYTKTIKGMKIHNLCITSNFFPSIHLENIINKFGEEFFF